MTPVMRTRSPALSVSVSASLSGVVMSVMPSAAALRMVAPRGGGHRVFGEGPDERVLRVALRPRSRPGHGVASAVEAPSEAHEQAHGERARAADAAGAMHEDVLAIADPRAHAAHEATKRLTPGRRAIVGDVQALARPPHIPIPQRARVLRRLALDLVVRRQADDAVNRPSVHLGERVGEVLVSPRHAGQIHAPAYVRWQLELAERGDHMSAGTSTAPS